MKTRINKIKDESFRLTPRCLEVTKTVLCSVCDSDIVRIIETNLMQGVHKKRGLCIDLCMTWYELCMSDNFIVRGYGN